MQILFALAFFVCRVVLGPFVVYYTVVSATSHPVVKVCRHALFHVLSSMPCASSQAREAASASRSALGSARFYPSLDRLSDVFCRLPDRLSDQFAEH